MAEGVSIAVSLMEHVRRLSLPFRDGKPGVKYLRGFPTRYKSQLAFMTPTRREALRCSACNGIRLSEHFTKLENLMHEHRIDADRLFNLCECGVTPQRDIS